VKRAAGVELVALWSRLATDPSAPPPNIFAALPPTVQHDPEVAPCLHALAVGRGDAPIDAAFVEYLSSLPTPVARQLARGLLVNHRRLSGWSVLRQVAEDGTLPALSLEVDALLALAGDSHGAERLLTLVEESDDLVTRSIALAALAALPDEDLWRRVTDLGRTDPLFRQVFSQQLDPTLDHHRAWLVSSWMENDPLTRSIVAQAMGRATVDGVGERYQRAALLLDPDPVTREMMARHLVRRASPEILRDLLLAFGAYESSAEVIVRVVLDEEEALPTPAPTTAPHLRILRGPRPLAHDPVDLLEGTAPVAPEPQAEGWRVGVRLRWTDRSDPLPTRLELDAGDGAVSTLPLTSPDPIVFFVLPPGPIDRLALRVLCPSDPASSTKTWTLDGLLLAPILPAPLLGPPAFDATAPYASSRVSGSLVFLRSHPRAAWLTGNEGSITLPTGAAPPTSLVIRWDETFPPPPITLDGAPLSATTTGAVTRYAIPPSSTRAHALHRIGVTAPPRRRGPCLASQANARAGNSVSALRVGGHGALPQSWLSGGVPSGRTRTRSRARGRTHAKALCTTLDSELLRLGSSPTPGGPVACRIGRAASAPWCISGALRHRQVA
jgi:hypothetical protein